VLIVIFILTFEFGESVLGGGKVTHGSTQFLLVQGERHFIARVLAL